MFSIAILTQRECEPIRSNTKLVAMPIKELFISVLSRSIHTVNAKICIVVNNFFFFKASDTIKLCGKIYCICRTYCGFFCRIFLSMGSLLPTAYFVILICCNKKRITNRNIHNRMTGILLLHYMNCGIAQPKSLPCQQWGKMWLDKLFITPWKSPSI